MDKVDTVTLVLRPGIKCHCSYKSHFVYLCSHCRELVCGRDIMEHKNGSHRHIFKVS